MPLEPSTDISAHSDPGTLAVIFSTQNLMIDQAVSVIVSPDAIKKLGGSGNPVEVFQAHRSELERIASSKFDQQGGGTEVSIREEDLV